MDNPIKLKDTLSFNDLLFILKLLENPPKPNDKLKAAAQLTKHYYKQGDKNEH